jgi:hypothetical protein
VISIHGGRDAYLVTVVLYTPAQIDKTVIHQTIVTNGIRVVFNRDWRMLHKKYAVLVNGAVVSRG